MARLLDDLLDVSRLSRGRLTLQRAIVPLDDVVDAAIETSRPVVDQQGQQLHVSGRGSGIVLYADGTRLTQVFANILNNAAKYSSAGSRIDVTIATSDDTAVVRIRDQGIGIEPDMLERVFELFAQATDARSHAPGGLGIGLSLARRLVELHGGTIAVSSPGAGQGSEFTVSLPVAAPEAANREATAIRDARPRLPRHRVLVVDDNVDAADTTALLLGDLGCDVRTCYDGAEALREAERFTPDIALLDLGMRGMDGYDLCRLMRSRPWGTRMVIIAISGWGQDEDRQRTSAAGFDRHLVKPVDPEMLIQVIRESAAPAP
jgi:CheY-like chemotaxis protein